MDPGVVIEPTLKVTPSRRESTAVNPWASLDGGIFQVRLCGRLGRTCCGVIILERRLPPWPILMRVQMCIANSLVQIVMVPWNRNPLELAVPLHRHKRVHH